MFLSKHQSGTVWIHSVEGAYFQEPFATITSLLRQRNWKPNRVSPPPLTPDYPSNTKPWAQIIQYKRDQAHFSFTAIFETMVERDSAAMPMRLEMWESINNEQQTESLQ